MNPATEVPATTIVTFLDAFHAAEAPMSTSTAIALVQAQGWSLKQWDRILMGSTGHYGGQEIHARLNADGTVKHLWVIAFTEPRSDQSLESAQDIFVIGVAEATRRWGPPTRRLVGAGPEASWNFGPHNLGLTRRGAIVTVEWTTEVYHQLLDAEIGQPDYLDEELD
jgi:hypothetical protein